MIEVSWRPGRGILMAVIMAVCPLSTSRALAQNVTGISAPREVTVAVDGTRTFTAPTDSRIAVPVGVTADLGAKDQKGVAPSIGFQVWKNDRYFLGAFFTLAALDPIVAEKYGSFVLNPPLKGRSFYVSGNYIFDIKNDWPIRFGVGGRWGTSSAAFERTPAGGSVIVQEGFALVSSITGQVMSKTFYMPLGSGDERGEFQLGVELGPTWRLLGGDLSENDAFRQQLLGTSKSGFRGFETTFFVRVNAVQPFARFTYFPRPADVVIPGMTGRQIVWGINVASALFSAKAQ